jgi:predicted PurR-regulated permease PerM
MGDQHPETIILWVFLSLFIGSILMLGWLFWPFLSIIVVAAVVTGLFNPVYRLIHIKNKINPPIASLLTCILIFFILFIPTIYFVTVLSKEAYELYLLGKDAAFADQFKNLIEKNIILERVNLLFSYLNIEVSIEDLKDPVSEVIKSISKFLYDQAMSIASNIFAFFINFFLMLIVCYYLFIDGDRLVSFLVRLSPLPQDQDEKLIRKFKDMVRAILVVNGFSGLIQGALGGGVFWIFGLPSSFFWGVIMALLAFLPILGIGAVYIPAAFYLFLKGRVATGIFFLLFYILVSSVMEYIVKPKFVGDQVKMHVLLIFFSIFGGLKLFGILGILFGPLVVTAFLTLTDIYYSSYRKMVTPN